MMVADPKLDDDTNPLPVKRGIKYQATEEVGPGDIVHSILLGGHCGGNHLENGKKSGAKCDEDAQLMMQ